MTRSPSVPATITALDSATSSPSIDTEPATFAARWNPIENDSVIASGSVLRKNSFVTFTGPFPVNASEKSSVMSGPGGEKNGDATTEPCILAVLRPLTDMVTGSIAKYFHAIGPSAAQ